MPRQGNGINDDALYSLAHGMVVNRVCCTDGCLWQNHRSSSAVSLDAVVRLVLSCLEEVHNMSKQDKRDYLR